MANPKVIIADTDINYIAPLQYKFVNEFFNNIDLEVITNRQYFEEYFANTQSAAVLVVSEDLFNDSIKGHNIKNIFVMSENMEDDSTGDLSINVLYKYTSIVEIFSEIVAKSAKELASGTAPKKETQVIVVTSGAGGVGKTTLAMGLALILSERYKSVLYLNAAHLQNFQYLMEDKTPITAASVYDKAINPTENIYLDLKSEVRTQQFSYIPAFKAALVSTGMDASIYRQMVMSAKDTDEYDYIIVDTDSSFDGEKLQLLDAADKVLVVTEQSRNSVLATNNLVANINGVSEDKYIFACNKFRSELVNDIENPGIDVQFNVAEHVGYEQALERCDFKALAENKDIKKISSLIM